MINSKKKISLLLSILMILLTFGPMGSVSAQEMTLSQQEIQITEEGTVNIQVDFQETVEAENLTWTLDGKPLEEWKAFNKETGNYELDPWIKITNVTVNGSTVTATLENTLAFGVKATDQRPYPRREFMNLLGTYDLTVKDEVSGQTLTAPLKINNYKGFYKFEEIKPELDRIIAEGNAKGDRHFAYTSLGKSVEGRDLHGVIVAKDSQALDTYLNQTLPEAQTNPKGVIDKINNNTIGDYKVLMFVNNIHPDETPGVDAQISLLQKLASQDEIEYNSGENNQTATLNIDNVLDNTIMLFSITQNPDGREYNTRENANGLDVNRDNAYQTQPEAKAMAEAISTYNPLVFLDLHGFVKEFLIEPCTPPHEPNFEYDLLMGGPRNPETKDANGAPGAIENAKRMGEVGVANSKYEEYIIPLFDYGDGWDDAFLGYTGVYALIHGALGHTIEMPEQNLDSLIATEHALIGSIEYILNNKDTLYKNQLEIFRRGLENEDNKNVDTWHVDPQGNQIGRPREGNENFFPDYYILPVDDTNQKNPLEVYEMVNYFLRNKVKVYRSTADVAYNGVTYPAGSIVVPLNQVKRSLANAALFTGTDESAWNAMYAEVVLNFPAMKGFDSIEAREKALFDNKMEEITSDVQKPVSAVNVNTAQAVLKNTNNDATKLVNKLLDKNIDVQLVTKADKGADAGDFIIATDALRANVENLFVKVIPLNGEVESKAVVAPSIYIGRSGSNYSTKASATKLVLENLGFNLVENLAQANTIVDSSGVMKKEEVAGKNYIAIGGGALEGAKVQNLYPLNIQMNENGYGNEGLLKANYNITSPISGFYEAEDKSYIASGTVLGQPREEALVFSKVKDEADFFIQGWWPNHNFVQGQILGFADRYEDTNFVFFAADVTNKAYTSHLFRQLSNSIYAVNNDTLLNGESLAANPRELSDISGHWAERTIRNLAAKSIINGYDDKTFKPENSITRAEFIKIIVEAFSLTVEGEPSVTFGDITDHWAKENIETAATLDIIDGYDNETFGPNNNITREEMAKIMVNVVKANDKAELNFTDSESISDWAKEFVEQALGAELVQGYPDNTFKPQNNVKRAEAAVVIERAMNK